MQDVFDIIEQRKDVYLGWLTEICQQPSVAAQDWGMVETAALVERMLKDIGADVKQVPTAGYPVVYGEIGGKSDKTLSFYDHYDVQPPEPLDLWDSEPFGAEVRDGTLYARGVADNKGNLIARVCAIDAYLRARGELPVNVKFIFEGEEEIGSPNLGDFADAHPNLIAADGCIWEAGYCDPQGRREVYLGLKGILYVELSVEQANVDLHSMWAAVVPSGAWRLLHALRTLKDEFEQVLIPGFYDKVLEPTESDLAALQTMPFDEAGRKAQLGLDGFVNDLSGIPLLQKLIFQPTCNIAGIESGYTGQGMKTVLPHAAKAKLDFRLVPDQDPHEIHDLLVKHLQNCGYDDVKVNLMAAEHPARTPTDHAFAKTVIDAVQEVYGHAPVVYPITPGSGPMYELCQKHNIPAVSIGIGNENSRNHAPNENIHLKDFYDGIRHLSVIVDRFGGD